MTYQELLDEFCNRIIAVSKDDPVLSHKSRDVRISNLEWAMRAILEKLRDTQEGPKG